MIPRFGRPPQPGQSYRPRPGVYAILLDHRGLLATWQGGIHEEIQLPGGGIDPGESPLQALHREVMEETGWIIAQPRRVGAHRRFTYMPEYDRWAEKICSIYLARPVRQLRPPSEPDHFPLWLDPAEAVRLLATEGDAAVLAQLLGA
ncbi:MAG: NUDIX hydrolase [Rhodobacterales bacterium]|nr:MAG: NUDIX hydrolase [Rhodobacterales bacterium]